MAPDLVDPREGDPVLAGVAQAAVGPLRPGLRSARWSDFSKRLWSGLILAPIGLGAIWLGGLAWLGVLTLAATLTLDEWSDLCRLRSFAPTRFVSALTFVLAAVALVSARPMLALLALVAGVVTIALLARRLTPALGPLYICPAPLALIWLRAIDTDGVAAVAFVVLLVWASDIGGYVFGRLLAGPRLAPSISPGKTWAGAAGALVTAALCAVCLALLLHGEPGRAIWVASIISVAGQVGDLLESAIKRHFGVKDTGPLIPGHGGALDRFDALLIAAPVAMVLIVLFQRGDALWR